MAFGHSRQVWSRFRLQGIGSGFFRHRVFTVKRIHFTVKML